MKGGQKQRKLSRSRTNSGAIIHATLTTTTSQVISSSGRKGKPATTFSPLPFRTEKGDTTTYTSNFITSKTTSLNAPTLAATPYAKAKPTIVFCF